MSMYKLQPWMFVVPAAIAAVYYLFFAYLKLTAPPQNGARNYDPWGNIPSHWDHPEPNYIHHPTIAEWFAAITTVPVAASLLIVHTVNEGTRRRVWPLVAICFAMYVGASISHSTLHPLINSVTLTLVVTNGIYSFLAFSGHFATHVGGPLSRFSNRALLAFASECLVIALVAILPPIIGRTSLGPAGGVPALTFIQTPAVLIATVMVTAMHARAAGSVVAPVYARLKFAGFVLLGAMGISFLELYFRNDWAVLNIGAYWTCVLESTFGGVPAWVQSVLAHADGFPVFHCAIHVCEQIGIYTYVVGVMRMDVADAAGALTKRKRAE